ncbi:MAG: YIP1 family protein [Pseudomonadota bacterium]
MPVTRDIRESYRKPAQVMRRLLADGQREDRALAILMGGAFLAFLFQLPKLSRQAHLQGEDLTGLMANTLFACLFFLPLIFYGIAAVTHIIARIFGGKGTWYGARLALFWSFLAASPLMLLNGLVAGLVGDGVQLQIVGLLWFLVFGAFWFINLRVAESAVEPDVATP